MWTDDIVGLRTWMDVWIRDMNIENKMDGRMDDVDR